MIRDSWCRPATVLLLLAAFLTSACGGEVPTDAGVVDARAACTAGERACACRDGAMACDPGLTCVAAVCQPCPAGERGCGCYPNNTCNTGLSCNAGRCVQSECTAGSLNCVCRPDMSCDLSEGRALACVMGRCVAAGCTPGAAGCPCAPGDACNSGLTCAMGLCVGAAGAVGGRCLPDLTCTRGARCAEGMCVACTAGSPGCDCTDTGTCTARNACVAGRCVTEVSQVLRPPASPVCYTPCRDNLTRPSGEVVTCDADGLMPTCLNGSTCTQGSCVPTGRMPPTCTRDLDCPDFQGCIAGRCYAQCTGDGECPAGTGCARKVCRIQCNANNDTCPTGSRCERSTAGDGRAGFCMPMREREGMPRTTVAGQFELSVSELSLSNVNATGAFTITNRSNVAITFTVRKTEHTLEDAMRTRVTTNALPWLRLGSCPVSTPPMACPVSTLVSDGAVEFPLGPMESRQVQVGNAGAGPAGVARWSGILTVGSSALGERTVSVGYSQRPEGQWGGSAYYFSSFSDQGLDAWLANRSDIATLRLVRNAMLSRWAAFRDGTIDFDELRAVLSATVRRDLPTQAQGCAVAVCYPRVTATGVSLLPYTDNADQTPIPSGITEMPLALNLRAGTNPNQLAGAIASGRALQYPNTPAITLGFATDPAACATRLRGRCATFLSELAAEVRIGGRYRPSVSDPTCTQGGMGFRRVETPWLVPEFTANTLPESGGTGRVSVECRDATLPYAGMEAMNLSLAVANPVPDGRSRSRRLELLDGVMVDQQHLVVLFRERLDDALLGLGPGSVPVRSYGVMMLQPTPAALAPSDTTGNTSSDVRSPQGLMSVACSGEILQAANGGTALTLSTTNVNNVLASMISGLRVGAAEGAPADPVRLNYLCLQSGRFNGDCPTDSPVRYFLTSSDRRNELGNDACNARGECGARLQALETNREVEIDPVWRCTNMAMSCETRADRRTGKTFFSNAGTPARAFVPLENAIQSSFLFWSQFRSRTGATLGFTPGVCTLRASTNPYCFNPVEMERTRARLDCVQSIFANQYAALSAPNQRDALAALTFAYGTRPSQLPGAPAGAVDDGFERMYAQLLIMLGDNAFTNAFNTRYDLAAAGGALFAGGRFESGGSDLTGVLGAEMSLLYRAVQYYDLALERFYRASPLLAASIDRGAGDARNYITPVTILAYFDRISRASLQKTRTLTEIARRYLALNRTNLARQIMERAYSSASLESMVIDRLSVAATANADRAQRDAIRGALAITTRMQNAALLDMRQQYEALSSSNTVFGFDRDYVPLASLGPTDQNGFTQARDIARRLLSDAEADEANALQARRDYDSDAEQFQAELVRIRNNYNSQLARLCGTFVGEDGNSYPATSRYANLSAQTRRLRDPCGLLGPMSGSEVYSALVAVDVARLDVRAALQAYDQLFAEISIEQTRIDRSCNVTTRLADFEYTEAGRVNNLQSRIDQSRNRIAEGRRQIEEAERSANDTGGFLGGVAGLFGGIIEGNVAAALGGAAQLASTLNRVGSRPDTRCEACQEREIAQLQAETREIERAVARNRTLAMCESNRVDSEARVKTLWLRLANLDVDLLRQRYRLNQAASAAAGIYQQAQRLNAEMDEAIEVEINRAAARNDPNTRIYRNSAVIAAERSFSRALSAAYLATRAFEYYSSTSYANFESLYLVRLANRGDGTLRQYLNALDVRYDEFGRLFGEAAPRVAVISLRDDIFSIPRLDTEGRPVSQADRISQFRQRLTSRALLDSNGWVTIPFSTSIAQVSPITRNHKINVIEIEVLGANVGDNVGRIYLRQTGTGVVRPLMGEPRTYRLEQRSFAVVNALFNGFRPFLMTGTTDLYTNQQLRDRPFVNSQWLLSLNQVSERDNQDIDLNSLTDIRIYVYYKDFTGM